MHNFEETNWALLKERFKIEKPNVELDGSNMEIFASRSGLPSVRVKNSEGKPILLHSSIDPIREAKRLVETLSVKPDKIVLVKGFGLGYLVEALEAMLPDHMPIIVVEPDPVLFAEAMRIRDLRPLIQSKRISWVIADEVEEVKPYLYNAYDATKYGGVEFVGLSGSQVIYETYFNELPKMVKEVVSAKYTNLATLIYLGPEQIINAMENLPSYINHPGLNKLFDQFTGVPAIIVSAGPSLDKNIDLLHDAKGKVVIIAVGTAVKALQKRGIQPDFIVTIDPLNPNYEHFKGIDSTQAALIADIQTHPKIVAEYQGPIFMASCSSPVVSWVGTAVEEKGHTVSGGSVANDAMTAAYKMGADPIVLIGQDLSFPPDGRTHASGTTYEKDKHDQAKEKTFWVKANNGGQVLTIRGYYHFLRFFEDWFRIFKDRKYINATEGGAYIEGTVVMTLREVLDQYCTKDIDVQKVLRDSQKSFKRPKMKRITNTLHRRLREATRLFDQAERAILTLQELARACEEKKSKKINRLLVKTRKACQSFEADRFIIPAAERFIQKEIHTVLYKTYRAGYAETDDYHEAVGDYIMYFGKTKSAITQLQKYIEMTLQRVEKEGEARK